MSEWLQLVGGALLLYFGAEWCVGGASALALALRVPQILIGLTVVAYGTSAPELIVGVEAALAGRGEVALGNIIGSNIANIGLILGISALIQPAHVDGSLRRRELPVLIGGTALAIWLLRDGSLARLEAGLLLVLVLSYTLWMIRSARSASVVEVARLDAIAAGEAADAAGAPKTVRAPWAAVTALVGLAVLLVGGNLFIDGAISVAQRLDVDDRLIGLTVVAIGTSLPELVASIIAARRGHSDLAVGNVIGSNIFNILLCLGAAGVMGSIHAPERALSADLAALAAMTCIAAIFIRSERTISRLEGGGVVMLYAAFLSVTVAMG